jgi:hypothetical protein
MLKSLPAAALAFVLAAFWVLPAQAQDAPSSPGGSSSGKSKFDTLTEGMTKVDGMWTLYQKDQKLLAHLKTGDLNKNYLVLTSIARGVSRGMVLGGMSWGFGDDTLWTFRKTGEKIHVLRRNVRFKAQPGTPEADAVKLAYSDSVLYALPILTTANGGYLVDLTSIFMSDDQQIGRAIGPTFRFASDRSTWAKIKGFENNIELQVAAVYAGSGSFDTVADTRGVQVNVHYSISLLPSNSYKPRKADDRIGYFLTVIKDFSNTDDEQHFVRYINRWDLKKEDPTAKVSNPEKRIRFYIEKTVPKRLRPHVQAGIEEWNKAFEQIGFNKAIEVIQQQDGDDMDPEDVNYNFFRWITAEAGFAMGPSRVNPMTGQILDADIIFDASFMRYWKTDYETFTDADVAGLMGRPIESENGVGVLFPQKHEGHAHTPDAHCTLCRGMQQQMGFSAAVLAARGLATPKGELPEEFIAQALKEVVMHEVGHTLGLRHNFKASSWKSLEEMDQMSADSQEPTVASVMDYSPANIAPKGSNQGPYFTPTLGPYDHWAIEYGYSQFTSKEDEELKKIASRSAEPGLDYATDEDTRFVDSDPLSNRFDLGKNPIDFARRQMKLSSELLPNVVDRTVADGDGYQKARQAFGMLFSEYWRTAQFAARVPGGVYVHRDHKGDKDGRPPFKVVEAESQRDAMKLLAETAFASPSYDHNVLNHLAATRWNHWGIRTYSRLDYPIHEFVERMQAGLFLQLLDPLTLSRLQDGEIKTDGEGDVYTLAEHLRLLVESVFSEFEGPEKPGKYTDREPYISSFRRNLQRIALKRLGALVTNGGGAPEDARTLARMHLSNLDGRITVLLNKNGVALDDYSKAHLTDTQNRIRQILNANLGINSIN